MAVATVLGGVVAATWWPEPGVRALGVGLIALTWWLARHDVARRTVRQRGLTRFMAVSLLGGYVWLGVGGAIAAVTGVAMPGVLYDALLHAVFVGFVMSMVFAHAPIIFPAVLGLPLAYRPSFYLHVGVLHVSLIVRVVGDLVDVLGTVAGSGAVCSTRSRCCCSWSTRAVRWPWEECVANPSEMPGAAPVAPLTLAAYQEGAVVSRILLKRGGGTVTLFAFDEGQSLSEHTAPFDAVAHVLEGEALITIAGVPLTVPAGDIVLMPANQPHAVAARTRFKMLLTMIRPA